MSRVITSICFQVEVLAATIGSTKIPSTLRHFVNSFSYSLIAKMTASPDKFSLHADAPAHVWNLFQKWYSRTGVERPNNVLQGEFQSYATWWNDWYSADDDEDEDDDDSDDDEDE
jgi:hypothetical protein